MVGLKGSFFILKIKNISNKELYDANKVAVREDMKQFETEVYKVEDSINVELLSRKAGK